MSERHIPHWTSNPSEDGSGTWFVWDMNKQPADSTVIFVGTLEECGGVVDTMNARVARESSLTEALRS